MKTVLQVCMLEAYNWKILELSLIAHSPAFIALKCHCVCFVRDMHYAFCVTALRFCVTCIMLFCLTCIMLFCVTCLMLFCVTCIMLFCLTCIVLFCVTFIMLFAWHVLRFLRDMHYAFTWHALCFFAWHALWFFCVICITLFAWYALRFYVIYITLACGRIELWRSLHCADYDAGDVWLDKWIGVLCPRGDGAQKEGQCLVFPL